MSDEPSKNPSLREVEPLDDIILGDDDATVASAPPVAPPPARSRPSAPPALGESRPPDRTSVPPATPSAPPLPRRSSSNHMAVAPDAGVDARDSQSKKRSKMTLRIPDDEISRPQMPVAAPAEQHDSLTVPLVRHARGSQPDLDDDTSADDTLELPADETRGRLAALTMIDIDADRRIDAGLAPGVDGIQERGWTPFQPIVDDDLAPIQPTPIVDIGGRELGGDPNGATHHAEPVGGEMLAAEAIPIAPISEEIPVEMDLSEVPEMPEVPDAASDEIVTRPRLPATFDSEEIKIDEGDRISETGEVEVAPEDLVSVESLPSPKNSAPAPSPSQPRFDPSESPAKTAGKYPAYHSTPPPGPTATALMSGVAPSAAPSRPTMSAVSATPITDSVLPQPSTPRRPGSSPFIVPPVGGLAPPPMTDTAAMRKKVRPWWEELFNDDFIRTMARVTDGQIKTEVTFIEESLGCEAGAVILDLACGTGRHAVELAARGYQVVGFDLSLAMLARASDEAQDRKQKINFVQGDMREMTFDETFDGVFSWNTSFGYFDEEKNGAVIARVHKALKKGGQFILDVVNRDYIVRQAPSLAWFEGDGCICMDEMTIDFITSRMKVKRTLMMDDGRTKEIEYSIRIYSLHELGKMLHDNGFRVAEVSGRTSTPGVFFGCEAPRTLILAEKR